MSSKLIPIDTGRRSPYMLEVTSQEAAIRAPDTSADNLVIAHLTDFHYGFGNTGAVFEEAIAQVDAIKPDLVLLTGDYLDDHPTIRDLPMHELLSRLHGRLGVFGSFGNHDHRRGIVGSRRLLERSGVCILNNENIEPAPGLWLAGIDDLDEGEPELERTLRGLPTDRTSIILSHNPRLVDLIPEQDALILSGHTHGAQIALPFPSPAQVCRYHLKCGQVAGWYKNGKARVYVSRGLGVTGKPFRYRCPAEIAFMRLKSQSRAETRLCDANGGSGDVYRDHFTDILFRFHPGADPLFVNLLPASNDLVAAKPCMPHHHSSRTGLSISTILPPP